ncbi:MAG: alpha/beta fold hydrolase, partial [Planctomycetota bacterium]|nr:alpha/beta fold hydrolase [Planctomycetota bacterium]
MKIGRGLELSLWRAIPGVLLTILALFLSQYYDDGVTVERGLLTSEDKSLTVPVIWVQGQESPETAPTAILGHGLVSSKETMLCLAERLARAGFRCICLDFPGHGASDIAMRGQDASLSIEVAAMALTGKRAPEIPIDLYIGHSRGGSIGSEAIAKRRMKARLFVALGSFATPKRSQGEGMLYVTGRYDFLATPEDIEALKTGDKKIEVIISESADHVTEVWDPGSVDGCANWALEKLGRPKTGRSWNWICRALGSVLLLLGALLLSLSLSKAPESINNWGAGLIAVFTAGLYFLALSLGIGRSFMGLGPTLRQLPFIFASSLGFFILSYLLALIARRYKPESAYSAAMGQSGLVYLSVIFALCLFLQGKSLPGLLIGILALILLSHLIVS